MRGFWKKNKASDAENESHNESLSLSLGLEAAGETGAFPGLAESDLVALFNAAELVKFAPGDWLFGAEELARHLVVILAGRVELQSSDPRNPGRELATPGDWICDCDFQAPPSDHDLSALARTAGTALVIDAPTFHNLSDDIQSYLTLRMKRVNQIRLQRLRKENRSLLKSRTDLVETLYQLHTQRGVGFGQSQIVQQLFAKVPKLPVSSINLLNKILDERTTKNEIVEMVSMDPSLTSTLLKAVNSAAYGFDNKITNISHAVVLLGHDAVYQIVMSESMRYSLPDTPQFAEVHQRSIEISRIAFALAQTQQLVKPAEAATIGILSEIGLVIIELLKSYNPQLAPLFDYVDPAEMGAELLRSWKLPDTLCKTLHYQYYPEYSPPDRLPDDVRPSVSILYLSRRLRNILNKTIDGQPGVYVDQYIEALGLSDLTESSLVYDRVLPRLRSQIQTLPKSLAILVSAKT